MTKFSELPWSYEIGTYENEDDWAARVFRAGATRVEVVSGDNSKHVIISDAPLCRADGSIRPPAFIVSLGDIDALLAFLLKARGRNG